MRVLIACEESQAVCIEFRKRGHEAYSCDILPCSGGHPEWHIQGDIRDVLRKSFTQEVSDVYFSPYDLIIAHPPCTRLANSGVRWLNERNLWNELCCAIEFFKIFQTYNWLTGIPTAIENPIPHKYARDGFELKGDNETLFIDGIGKYSQLIQPYHFGHNESKSTCLWLYGLPELKPTNIVEPEKQSCWRMPPSGERAKLRSKTYPGIARAMAEQWSEDLTK